MVQEQQYQGKYDDPDDLDDLPDPELERVSNPVFFWFCFLTLGIG